MREFKPACPSERYNYRPWGNDLMEFKGGTAFKFYEVRQWNDPGNPTGAVVCLRYGRIGRNGQTKFYEGDAHDALAFVRERINSKMAKGYVTSAKTSGAAAVPRWDGSMTKTDSFGEVIYLEREPAKREPEPEVAEVVDLLEEAVVVDISKRGTEPEPEPEERAETVEDFRAMFEVG